MRQSTKSTRPGKPHPAFPLYAHANGQWAKKVKKHTHFFGVWDDPQAALQLWLAQKDDLLAGRVPRETTPDDAPTLHVLCNAFLHTKAGLRDAGELSVHSWNDYHRVCEVLIATFGRHRLLSDLLPEDFEKLRGKWAEKLGKVRLGNEINRTRVIFNYAYKNGLIDRPMRYGEGFKRPSKKTLRLARAEKGLRMFEADELQRVLKAAKQPMKAMILLGINCGLGNNDVGVLPRDAIDLNAGWLNYPRPKTGLNRRCPLWPETIGAIRAWLRVRPAATRPEDEGLVFVTSKGGSWSKATSDNPVSKEMRKLLDEIEIGGNRNFYALRHTFETIAGESRDQVAVDAIMGHARDDMASAYRERISDERLQDVTAFVHGWLFTTQARKPKAAKKETPRLRIAAEPDDEAAASA